MSLQYSLELLEYIRLTLRLVELHPHRKRDAHLAAELQFILRRRIAVKVDRQPVTPFISVRKSSAQASKQRAIAFHSATQRRIGMAVPAAGRGLLDCRKVLPLTLRCQDFPRHSAISF